MTLQQIILPYPDFMLGQFIDPDAFDLNNATMADAINAIVKQVNIILDSTEPGNSGADNVSMTAIAPFASTKLQSFLKEMNDHLTSGNGAAYIGSSAITGVSGTTARAQLVSLKSLLDTEKARIDALTTRMTTAETNINNRYTKAEVDAKDNALQLQINTNKTDIANRYTKAEVDSKDNTIQSQVTSNKSALDLLTGRFNSHNHDDRYLTKSQLAPYLQGGDTVVKMEVFNIVTSNNGNGTFTYTNRFGATRTGRIGEKGEQIFNLEDGEYLLNMNHIKGLINDTLHRSVASGGLIETSTTSVALSSPEGAGTELTIEYYQRLGVSGEHNIIYGTDVPPPTDGATMWFKVVT